MLSVAVWFLAVFPGEAATSHHAKHVVILKTLSSPFIDNSIHWFRKEMERYGYVEGANITYKVLNARGDALQAVAPLSTAIAERRPDLVLTVATLATRAGRELLSMTRIPQLFMIVTDPVGEGFTDAIGKASGSNITGLSHVVPAEFQLAVVSEVLKTAKRQRPFRFGILRSDYPSAESEAAQLLKAARRFSEVEFADLVFHYIPGQDGRAKMTNSGIRLISDRRREIDGIWLVAGPNQSDKDFFNAVVSVGIPIVNSANIENAKQGAMIALQSTAEFIGKDAAEMAVSVFNGVPTEEMPVTRPRRFEAGVNVTTASRLDAVIPSAILELAKRNVFH